MEIKNIIILGPFCSGTNLIQNILTDNCVNKNNEKIIVIKNNVIHWKHTLNMELIEKVTNNNTLIIVMYKNVYNWISSICDDRYWFDFDKINDKAIFTVSIKATEFEKKFHEQIIFDNIIEAHNVYYQNYLNLKKNNNVIFIDYKKIIFDNNFNYLNNKLNEYNLSIHNQKIFNNVLCKPSKNHGLSVTNNIEAINKYDVINLKIKNAVKELNLEKYINYNIMNFFENC